MAAEKRMAGTITHSISIGWSVCSMSRVRRYNIISRGIMLGAAMSDTRVERVSTTSGTLGSA